MTWQLAFLEARDRRQQALLRSLRETPPQAAASFFLIGTNIPGDDKHRPGLARLLKGAREILQRTVELKVLFAGRDLLGHFYIGSSPLPPIEAKRAALAIEAESPAARLLDLDVYRPDGSPVDRPTLGSVPRSCLLCAEPARECILLKRHSTVELLQQVDSLLRPLAPPPRLILPERLAANLRLGVLRELDLTPKPGLVDRHDCGSHADLSYDDMESSAELLPAYFTDILECQRQQRPLQDFVQAGIAAERRMFHVIHSNAHKGFIFLSGLTLMAACRCGGQVDLLRQEIARVAGEFFAHFGSPDSYGAQARNRHKVGGICTEAEQGLPSIFEHGWPKYREALDAGWSAEHAGFYLMAVLMQKVEDTTALHRCGLEGLARLRRDGLSLQRLLEQQQAPEPMLAALNREYSVSGLTMGGVADCLALTFALQETAIV